MIQYIYSHTQPRLQEEIFLKQKNTLNMLSLPVYPGLDNDKIAYIMRTLEEILGK